MIRRTLVFAASLVVLISVVLWAPVTIPYTLELAGRVMPVQEWVVMQGADGQIRTRGTDHRTGAVTAWTISEVERGDAVTLDWMPDLWERGTVSAGDTVATIRVAQRSLEEARLEGVIAVAQATVRALESGEEEALIAEATQQIRQAEAQRDQQARVVDRLRTLRAQNLVAEEEVEAAESLLEVWTLAVQEAEARRRALETGATAEQVAVAQAQVAAARQELDALRKRAAHDHVVVPFDGTLLRSFAPDTLVHVVDTSAAVVLVPVPVAYGEVVGVGELLTPPRGATMPGATILHVSKQAFVRGGQTFVIVTARLEEAPAVQLGTRLPFVMDVREVDLRTYLWDVIVGAN